MSPARKPSWKEVRVTTSADDLNAARALSDAGRWDEAADLCRTILAQDIDDPPALHLLGVVLLKQGKPAEAVPLLAALAERFTDQAILHALGEALHAVGLTPEAESRWREAIALPGTAPDVWLSLGNLLLQRDDVVEAEHCFRSAVAARPDFVEGLHNLGNALVAQRRLDEACQCYATALAYRPASAGTGFAYALALLSGGHLADGWRQFESRREVGPLRWNYHRRPELPQWQPGMTLDGKRVLLMAEQGFGDVIQFVRYAPLLAARATAVLLELPRDLLGVFAGLDGVAQFIALEDPSPACDIACPLLSLPLYLNTPLAGIPAAVPYAAAPVAQTAHWRAWLGPARGRRIGLVCSGRPEHPLDRFRSVPLERLAPLLTVPGCDFILLQQQLREQDQAALAVMPGLRWAGPQIRDFGDTAALLAELDLLVTVDTSVAHLAGALARPVWTMLPFAPDFRWLQNRSDSPWYPTMRLYRQQSRGDWDQVVAAVQRDLATIVTTGDDGPS